MKRKIPGRLAAAIFILSSISCGLLPGTPAAVPTTALSSATQTPLPTEVNPTATQLPAPTSTDQPPDTQPSLPTATDPPPATQTPIPTSVPDPRAELVQLISDIHNQYEFDSWWCSAINDYQNSVPYEEAQKQIITILLTHPAAQPFTLAE